MFASKLQNFNKLSICALTHLTSSRGFHAGAISMIDRTIIDIDFKSIQKYKDIYGNLLIPQSYDLMLDAEDTGPQGYKLGQHANSIRHTAKHYPWRISPDDLAKLNEMSFVWNSNDERFRRIITALVHYKKLYGSTVVPTKYVVPEDDEAWPLSLRGFTLGGRLSHVVRQKLTPKKIEFMEALGITAEELFDENRIDKSIIDIDFKSLQKYKDIHGDLRIPQSYNLMLDVADLGPKGLKLGQHVKFIRTVSKLYPWRISPDNLAKLNEMGFIWDFNDQKFRRIILALVHYKKLYGTVLVPRSYVVPEDAEDWPVEMRRLRLGDKLQWIRTHELPPRQLEYMESLGISSETMLKQLAAMLIEALTIYKKVHKISKNEVFTVPGDFIVPSAEPWPQHIWGLTLGVRISGVRTKGNFQEYHEEFRSLGLDFKLKRGRRKCNDST